VIHGRKGDGKLRQGFLRNFFGQSQVLNVLIVNKFLSELNCSSYSQSENDALSLKEAKKKNHKYEG